MLSVPVQIAASARLAKYLSSVMPDVQFELKWPDPSKKLPQKAVTIIPAGKRNLVYMEYPQLVSSVDLTPPNKQWRWRVAECEQPIQMDVWAQFSDDRDDIVARLDKYINVGFSELSTATISTPTVDQNIVLELEDDWFGSVAYFTFDEVDYRDTPDQVQRQEYRATYKGMGFFNLSQDAISPQIASINIKLKISESDLSITDTTTATTFVAQ